jgi:hypothetical protein
MNVQTSINNWELKTILKMAMLITTYLIVSSLLTLNMGDITYNDITHN